MHKHKQIIILIACLIIISSTVLYLAANGLILNSSLESKEWKEFVNKVKKDNPFIKSIALGDIKPALLIHCKLNKEIDIVEAEKAFGEIRSFILSKEKFEYLQNEYIRIHRNGFMHLYIEFDYSKKDEIFDYQFFSWQNTSGIATYDSFKTWTVNVKGKFYKEITP